MCAAIDNKKGLQKILYNIFSRPIPSPSSGISSNHNEIDKLRTDAIRITQPNRKTSLQLQQRQTRPNASLPMELMNSPNLAPHSQPFLNGGGGNVNNNFHISGSDAVHIGNNIQIIQNSSKNAIHPSPNIERETTNIEKPKRFLDNQKEIVDQLKRSTIEITEEILTKASENISPKNDKFMYRYLGLSDAKIDMIEKDNFTLHGSQEVIYKMLLHWKQSADNPTIGRFIRALYKFKYDQCINELIKHFTENGTLSKYITDQ